MNRPPYVKKRELVKKSREKLYKGKRIEREKWMLVYGVKGERNVREGS